MHWRQTTLALLLFPCLARPVVAQEETKTLVAYSMSVAQARVEEAVRKGEDFRKSQPDLYYLGGIMKPWAVVIDTVGKDWILVGERDQKSSILTLDDWVTALRARFIHPEKDPGVTIDPRPCEECLKAGKKEGCSHYTRQDVRFFCGIEHTHFGQVCFEADWLMKRIGLGLERLPVKDMKTYYDLSVEQHRDAGGVKTDVGSRFWFYPIVNRVNVFDDVVLLEKFQMGVFTEVLYAEIDGKPVADVDKFEHYPSEGFSRSFSDNYDAAAESREMLETLRGLTRLAALAKGLAEIEARPQMDYCLLSYPRETTKTETEVQVLTVQNQVMGLRISGGVSLNAIALRLQSGDASVLRDLVISTRPEGAQASWRFQMEMHDGQPATIVLPSGLADPSQEADLCQLANFLYDKKRFDAAIESYCRLLELDPSIAEVYYNRGNAYYNKGDCDRAIQDYNQALRLNTSFALAYNNRGNAYDNKGDYDQAIRDYDEAIRLNPSCAAAFSNRGVAYGDKGDYDRAIQDLDQALRINPDCAEAYNNRGNAYDSKGDHDRAIQDFDQALTLNTGYAAAYNNRGSAHYGKGDYDLAIQDFNQVLELNPNCAEAYYNRGLSYVSRGEFDRAIQDFDQALGLSPDYAWAHNNRGHAYYRKGDYDRAIQDLDQALSINPDCAEAYYNRGNSYVSKGEFDQAIQDYDQTLRLNPNYVGVHSNRGAAYALLSQYDAAIADLDSALELNDADTAALLNRGNAFKGKRDYARAIADYDSVLALDAGEARAYYGRGLARCGRSEYELALWDFDAALRCDPGYVEIHYNRGKVCENLGRSVDAVESYQRFVSLAGDLPEYHSAVLFVNSRLDVLNAK